jgi:hypothetical protein
VGDTVPGRRPGPPAPQLAVRRALVVGLVAAWIATLALSSPAGAAGSVRVFTDGFEGGYGAWTRVAVHGGTAYLATGSAHAGRLGLRLGETAERGSVGFVRRAFAGAHRDLAATVLVRVVAANQGPERVPLIRLLAPSGASIAALHRAGGSSGTLYVGFGGTSRTTSAGLPVGTWARLGMRVRVNGAGAEIAVVVDGHTVYSSRTTNLGTEPVAAIQLGCDLPARPFALDVDDVSVAAAGRTVTVASIPALLAALGDDSVDEIVVADGTYHVSPSSLRRPDSLWIGAATAGRTRPVLVRAATRGGVVFDGAGAGPPFGGITFTAGAHDQTWDGFTFRHGEVRSTGVVSFGVYDGSPPPHHITMRFITVDATVTGHAGDAAAGGGQEHAFYIDRAAPPGPHDLLFEDITVDGTGGLASAFHFFHSNPDNPNALDVTVRRLHVRNTDEAIILWDSTLRNITFETADIVDSRRFAIRYEGRGSSGIVFRDIVSTGSGEQGFYSSEGPAPAGVTFIDVSLD